MKALSAIHLIRHYLGSIWAAAQFNNISSSLQTRIFCCVHDAVRVDDIQQGSLCQIGLQLVCMSYYTLAV